jgi:hypothetical protein
MLKESPDHHDADLILKIYDLRRETLLRESRARMRNDFWPRSAEEAVAVTKADHPLNTAYRQTSTYWEMVYGMAHHGVIHADFLVDNNAEGLMMFARIEPYLAAVRAATSPRTFRHTEWAAGNTETGVQLMEIFRARVVEHLARKPSGSR